MSETPLLVVMLGTLSGMALGMAFTFSVKNMLAGLACAFVLGAVFGAAMQREMKRWVAEGLREMASGSGNARGLADAIEGE